MAQGSPLKKADGEATLPRKKRKSSLQRRAGNLAPEEPKSIYLEGVPQLAAYLRGAKGAKRKAKAIAAIQKIALEIRRRREKHERETGEIITVEPGTLPESSRGGA